MNYTEQEIIEGCKKNDRLFQKALYDRFSSKLFVVCMRYSNNRQDAEDLFQESFIKLFQNIKKYNGTGSFEGWARKLFVNYCISAFRKKKYKEEYSEEMLQSEQEENWEVDTKRFSDEEILRAVNSLKEIERMVFNMAEIEQMSYKDIKEVLNIKEETLRSMNCRAKKKLQNYLLDIENKKKRI
ncbi:MAG: sigma-70 family RNA polymerase sigma factor [Bacteroidales bacterium]|nr:sigma-70 family RNA polymerase sigma factor [Bacteroidales bacterium]